LSTVIMDLEEAYRSDKDYRHMKLGFW